jgi:hypothetical protein
MLPNKLFLSSLAFIAIAVDAAGYVGGQTLVPESVAGSRSSPPARDQWRSQKTSRLVGLCDWPGPPSNAAIEVIYQGIIMRYVERAAAIPGLLSVRVLRER